LVSEVWSSALKVNQQEEIEEDKIMRLAKRADVLLNTKGIPKMNNQTKLTGNQSAKIFWRVVIYSLLICVSAFKWTSALAQADKGKNTIAFINAIIYPSPTAPEIYNGVVLIEKDKIIAVGKKKEVKIPEGASIIDCQGLTITAGFWNSHVHFIDPEISKAKELDDQKLSIYLQNFLTQYGFTYAFDIGSFPENTNNIKQRIENESISGPLILTTGAPLAPPNGTPFYLKAVNITLPELSSTGMATQLVNQYFSAGIDGIKVFAGSPVERGKDEVLMPLDIAKAVTKTAHQKGKPVFAHPSINEGLRVAISSGVDIIAHTTPDGGAAWDSILIQQMVANNIYLIPTLKLWKWSLLNNNESPEKIEAFVAVAIEQVKDFKAAGGNILFGTDIGFVSDFDPTDEYIYLQRAGLSFRQILATLTSVPSEKFGFANQFGKIAIGMNADMVVFKGDPKSDISVLADIKYTIRNGKVIYNAQK
jgi:imidazolonepropionase-like amidohydrolase